MNVAVSPSLGSSSLYDLAQKPFFKRLFSTEEWEEAVIAFFATLFAHDPDFIVVPEVIIRLSSMIVC